MEKKEIYEKMKSIIMETLEVENWDDVSNDDFFTSLGIDSLMALEILVRIEQGFDIEISDDDLSIDLLSSMDNLVEYVYEKRK